MLNQMKRWLEPPVFEGDTEKTTQTRFSNTLILYLGTALLIFIFIFIPLFAIQKIGSWILSITMFGMLVIGRNILFKGNYRQGTILIFSVIYLCIFALLILSGGSSNTAMFYFATVVLIAGFFLEKRMVNGLTIATFLVAMGISFLQDQGLVALPNVFAFNSIFSWIATGLGLLLMIRARDVFVGNLKNALELARQENAARQQAEEGLKSSLSLLQASLEATADGILVVNRAGIITKWNQKFAKLWNFTEEILPPTSIGVEVHNKANNNVLQQILSRLSDPEQFLDEVMNLVDQPGERQIGQIEFLDGRILECYSQPQRIDAEIVGRVWSFRDVTERKRILESLTASEARYRLLANNVPDIIYSLDSGGNIVTINSLALERYGYREQDAKGKSFLTFVYPEDREIVIRSFIKAAEEQRKLTHGLQFRIVAENGSIYWFELNSRADFDHDGRYLGEDGVLRDISARKQAEAALRESQELLALFMQHSPIYTYIKAVSPTEDRLLQASENMRELISIPSNQALVGKTMEELFAPEFAEKIRADDWAVVTGGEVLKLDEDLNGRHYTTIKFPLIQAGTTLLAGYTIDITERREAELALLEAQTLTNAIVDSTSDLIWSVDPENFGLLTFNHGLSDYFIKGRGIHIAIGMRPEDLFPPGEYVQKWRDFYQQALMQGSYTIEYKTYAGSVTLQLTFNLLKHAGEVFGISAFGKDITERKLAEAVLRDSENRFRAFVEQSPVSIGVFNLEGIGLYANRKFMEVLGLKDAEEVIGRPAHEFFAPEFREQSKERTQRRLQGLPVPTIYESTCVRADGTQFPVNLAVAPIQLPGGTASIAFLTDITERKRGEEDRIAREIAEQANRAKSEFISRMSHELRTPLNAILGFSQLLKMDELKPNQMRGVEQIYKSGRHLLSLVNEVLDIARIESGKMHISPEPLRLADTLQEALELILPLTEARQISILLETPASSDTWVQADPQSLRQVLLNLLSNAVKYNREAGEVAVTTRLTIDGRLRLQVRDTGEGIPPEKMARLFTPFDRLDRDSIEQEGTGLGLALSKGLVEAMGGRIGAESHVGQGSIFWVELKLVTERLTEAILTVVDEHLSDRLRSGRGLVLYVEDNLDNLRLVEAIMERLPQVKLITAMQGRLALALAQEHKPDLILLDLHLPDMLGSEVLRRLKADPVTENTPVIILSANVMPAQIAELLAGGARTYLTKPIDIQEFLRVVEESLAEAVDPARRPKSQINSLEDKRCSIHP